MNQENATKLFTLFNEIGIIEQLGRTILEAQLPKGLIAPHFSVLNHLIRVADGRTPRELARAFQVPKTSMTHTVSGLEKHGLVMVRPNPNDGRSKCVWITSKGHEVRNTTIASMAPYFGELLEKIDYEKLAAIVPVLTELRIILDEDRNAELPRDRDLKREDTAAG